MKRKYKPEQILQAIIDYKRQHDGCSPTTRDLMEATGVRSSSHMNWLLDGLAEAGWIQIGQGRWRSIEVAGGSWNYTGERNGRQLLD